MSNRVWTHSQKNAIEARKGTVLVSAAAGSGKTAVLVQRIIERITDKNNPCDADKILVATFTNAAAEEMRYRISNVISELISKNPNDINLQRQQILLKRAQISTIDSFCNNIVRENFHVLGVSPNFKISDNNDLIILREQAMQNVMDKLYEQSDDKFLNTVEFFSGDKDDFKFTSCIENIYDFLRTYPFYEQWFEEKISLYKEFDNISSTPWGKVIIDYSNEALEYIINLTHNSIELSKLDEKISAAYLPALSSDLNYFLDIQKSLKVEDWEQITKKVSFFEHAKLKTLRNCENEDIKEKIQGNRNYVKDIVKKLKKCFCWNNDDIKRDIQKTGEILENIFMVVKKFNDELQNLKKEKNLADFADLEHWTIGILLDREDGEYKKSKIAKELSQRFEEIMIDECQDINEIQDLIFRLISKDEKNLFMVGDVKQSIYGFRKAMPEIFLSRKEKYEPYLDEKDNYPSKIILDKNFRSREQVLETVNFIFRQIMSKQTGDIDYNSEEELKYGSNYIENENSNTELNILEINDDSDESSNIIEARNIAKSIAKMIKDKYLVQEGELQREVTYRDFCILLRSANKHADDYAKELNKCGIPVWTDVAGSFFNTIEISTMLSFLRIIDNPIQDISLVSVLVSPIYGFLPDDLSDIRLEQRDVPIYFALKKRAECGDKKCKIFLEDLEDYRNISVTCSIEKLIRKIYDTTGYTSIVQAMDNGELRLANLRMLINYAKKYEGQSYRGLTGFLSFLDKLKEKNADLSPANVISETSNVVRIMSIHRSKGLEFPICILAGCSRKFNKEINDTIFHNKLGLGVKLKKENNIFKYQTIVRQAIGLQIEKENIAEELRVLYVALTRAKEKLIIFMSFKSIEDFIKKISVHSSKGDNISPFVIRNTTSFAELILLCAVKHHSCSILRNSSGIHDYNLEYEKLRYDWQINIISDNNVEYDSETIYNNLEKKINYEFLKEIDNRFKYKYPYSHLNHIPVKMAASKLAQESNWNQYIANSRPAFMFRKSLTSAEAGTALHEFLFYANFKDTLKDIEESIKNLVDKGFISKEQSKVIDKEKITKFLNSKLGKRIVKSDNVLKEYRFSVRIPAKEFVNVENSSYIDENVIIQGAMDCVFEENNEFVIIDYKTDKVQDINILSDKYSSQLKIYKYAFEKCNNKKVKECYIYSFYLDEFIKII